ncbi:M48 family metalloprotease [Jiella sp. CBK1P-4]|uniref:M48 family metalloprotease n=2 Tax=Jiella avicenniae TaxID=2907202 RepID=A0A9X1T4Y0_9HYPH|nr:M48 family metalloprotease [Jiella avicenniae]MCE7027685.1 M48 family metalloprotease [Jiella avicenniae]MCE7028727.1 M48 family metalloprotease [Jiella avicenniae]
MTAPWHELKIGPRMRALLSAAAIGALAIAAGCTTIEAGLDGLAATPGSDSLQAGYTSTRQPITFETAQQGDPQSVIGRSQHPKILAAYGGAYSDPKLEQALAGIVGKLAAASDDPSRAYRITILNSPNINAFALPGGYVYITRGLLALANDSSEVAAVIGHEMGHITANHGIQRQQREQAAELASRVVSEVLENESAGQIALAKGKLSLAQFSRQQELQADDLGIRHVARAGYDPFAAARFLRAMDAYANMRNAFQAKDPNLDFLASHPSAPQRIQLAERLAGEVNPAANAAKRDRDRYLDGVDGMLFGDSAAEGYVRERTFLHPGLGISFTVPKGFVLDNTAEAVMATGPDDTAIRFDGVALPPNRSLVDYVNSGWIGGLEPGSVRQRRIHGLEAVSAKARGGEYDFDVTVVRLGGQVYRFLTAVPSKANVNAETIAVETADSFHQLTPQEQAALKPLRIRVVTAKSGDTAETLSNRMVGVDGRERLFRLLNELGPDDAVKSDQRYKIVAE